MTLAPSSSGKKKYYYVLLRIIHNYYQTPKQTVPGILSDRSTLYTSYSSIIASRAALSIDFIVLYSSCIAEGSNFTCTTVIIPCFYALYHYALLLWSKDVHTLLNVPSNSSTASERLCLVENEENSHCVLEISAALRFRPALYHPVSSTPAAWSPSGTS